MASERKPAFAHYQFREEPDVIYVGLSGWIERPGNRTPLLGPYLTTEGEVDAMFDELEADLRTARAKAKRAIRATAKLG